MKRFARNALLMGRRRQIILGLILDGYAKGKPPTYREMLEAIGCQSTTAVVCHLEALKKAGLIVHQPTLARTTIPLCRFIPADELEAAHA